MKKIFFLLILFLTSYSFSQSINNFKAVIIPMRYDFQNSENQFRLQTVTKMNLQKAGFHAFYNNEIVPTEFSEKRSQLFLDVKKESGFLVTKLYVTFNDCYGVEIFKSEIGKSREKDFDVAYVEALREAFLSINALGYKYNESTNIGFKSEVNSQSVPVVMNPVVVMSTAEDSVVAIHNAVVSATNNVENEFKISKKSSAELLYAQPTFYGYQLIDSEPKVVMKVYKTSNPTCFMATKGGIQGVLVSKENLWFFEYYQNDKLISEKVEVKF